MAFASARLAENVEFFADHASGVPGNAPPSTSVRTSQAQSRERSAFPVSETAWGGLRTGTVKFFIIGRGMGFIVDDEDCSVDVFLHCQELLPHGRDGLLTGTRVEYTASVDERGKVHATRILSIDESEVSPAELSRRARTVIPLAFPVTTQDDGIEFHPMRVKFYGKRKYEGGAKYGFLIDPSRADVFLHEKTALGCGFEHLKSGDMVEAAVMRSPKGRIAIAIRPLRS